MKIRSTLMAPATLAVVLAGSLMLSACGPKADETAAPAESTPPMSEPADTMPPESTPPADTMPTESTPPSMETPPESSPPAE